ncbi:MAG: type II toxin-antitoxin system VapB family antitoxin [Terriglobales bacterium]
MATSLRIENALIERARQAGGHKTKKEAVIAALEGYIRHHQQLRVLELFGTIDYDPDYDYKSARRRKHLKHVKPR